MCDKYVVFTVASTVFENLNLYFCKMTKVTNVLYLLFDWKIILKINMIITFLSVCLLCSPF